MSRALLAAALAVTAGACEKQVDPVRPSVRYEYPDRSKVGHGVAVGRPFVVHGVFDATCERSKAPLFAKNDEWEYGYEYVSCNGEPTRVDVTCAGACRVEGQTVTATAYGPLTVTVTLTSRSRHHQQTDKFVAAAPDSIRLEGCDEGPRLVTAPPWPRCTVNRPLVGLRVMGGGVDLQLPGTARANGNEQTGTDIQIDAMFDRTPSGELVDGEYDLDLSAGSFTGRARIVLRRWR